MAEINYIPPTTALFDHYQPNPFTKKYYVITDFHDESHGHQMKTGFHVCASGKPEFLVIPLHNIFRFISHGVYIRDVELPCQKNHHAHAVSDACIVSDISGYAFLTHAVEIGMRRDINLSNILKLVEMGADLECATDAVARWAIQHNHRDVLDLLTQKYGYIPCTQSPKKSRIVATPIPDVNNAKRPGITRQTSKGAVFFQKIATFFQPSQ